MPNARQFYALVIALLLTAACHCIAQENSNPIEVHVHRFSFQPNEITVARGQPVTIRLVSDDVTHGLVVKSLGINLTVSKDHPVDVRFTPEKAGDFRGQCGRFCGKGHGSMIFIIHVK